jgi:leader peptidase (prepilin peptidase)/N-methyltransferase
LGIVVGGGSFFLVAFLYEKFSGQEGLGGGDVKLLAMLGAWLGLESILILIVLSTFLGSLVGLFLIARGKATTKAAIPFGPFLAGSALIYLCAKQSLLEYFYPFYS